MVKYKSRVVKKQQLCAVYMDKKLSGRCKNG